MPLDTLSPSPSAVGKASQESPVPKASTLQETAEAIASASRALEAYTGVPESVSTWDALVESLHRSASAIAALPRGTTEQPLRDPLIELVNHVVRTGIHERLAAFDSAPVPEAKGWPGLVAVMLLRPAWWIPKTPELERLPDWLTKLCAEWLFAVPSAFAAPGQADRYAEHVERQLSELVAGVERNPGALAVRTALDCYQFVNNRAIRILQLSSDDLRRHAELHGRLVTRLAKKKLELAVPLPMARDGRRLRAGFIVPEFDGGIEMRATMPMLTTLDPERFECEVFVLRSTETRWETAARQIAVQVQTLPADFSEQAQMIASSMLDVLVFCSELAGSSGEIAKLATLRLAPLQVAAAAQERCTTGFSNIDLFAAGGLTEVAARPEQFCERLGVMPGPARTFDFVTGAQSPESQVTRADIGLSPGVRVFVAAAEWGQITPETHAAWARILAAVPDSYLLLQRIGTGETDADESARHCAAIDRAFAAAGVADKRLVILTAAPGTQTELEAVLSLGDVYLDTQPSGDDAVALAALNRGVPVVTLPGESLRHRRVAALLRSIGSAELIAANPDAFHQFAVGLATDSAARAAIAGRIQNVMACGPWPFDALAAGDAFGDLLEIAFDDLVSAGASSWRSDCTPLQVTSDGVSIEEHQQAGLQALAQGDAFIAATEARQVLRVDPTNVEARALLGRALLALGQPTRAVDYLLPSVEVAGANAARWFDLAQALQQNGQFREAVQALQTSLGLDASRADSWLLLIELAERVGALDLAQGAFKELKQHAPDHPELESIAARLGC